MTEPTVPEEFAEFVLVLAWGGLLRAADVAPLIRSRCWGAAQELMARHLKYL